MGYKPIKVLYNKNIFIYLIKIKGSLGNNTDTWDSRIVYMVMMMMVMFCNAKAKSETWICNETIKR